MSKASPVHSAVIEPVGGHGGCNYYDFALCQSITAAGGRADLYTCDKTEVTGTEGFSIHKNYVGVYGPDAAWLRALRFVRGAFSSVRHAWSKGARVAHFHFYHVGPLEVLSIVLARLFRLKVVITAHDVEAFKRGLSVPIFVRWAYGNADQVIAHNMVSRDELLNTLKIPSSRVRIIPHGNHLQYVPAEVTRSLARSKLGYSDDEFVIVFFGQIKEVKGLDVLIKAFAKSYEAHRNLRLLIAGKVWKDDFGKYATIISDLGIEQVVRCEIRYIPDGEVAYFYQCADLIALPYLKIYQSGVVLMAMSYGRPVLVSDIPGMLEVVEDNVSGLVFRSGDPIDMSRRISQAVESRALLDRVAEGGARRVAEDYDWGVIGRSTLECYNATLIPR
ncbi:glycosyltransferase family 4 protein [Aquincola sp. MAHUQ-54]|uniref:Glycosyltransferase family 4 protein n=1 Tax=Aquincola agrisoli TaxID=3119538 RepID=A0AAW9QB73_9BURK